MKISFKGDYATKIILDLSLNYNQGVTQIKDIAKRQDIPERYLEQIITLLKNARYINTIRGPKGGVLLAKAPSKITIGEIVRLVEGPTSPITCVSRSAHTRCSFEHKCVLKGVWKEVRDKINEVVDNTTYQDLVDRAIAMESKSALNYVI
jgi:Rrf2 family protein